MIFTLNLPALFRRGMAILLSLSLLSASASISEAAVFPERITHAIRPSQSILFGDQALTETVALAVSPLFKSMPSRVRRLLSVDRLSSSVVVREQPASYRPIRFLRDHANESLRDWISRGAGILWMHGLAIGAPIALQAMFSSRPLSWLSTPPLLVGTALSYLAGARLLASSGSMALSDLRGRRAPLLLLSAPVALLTMLGHASYNGLASLIGLPHLRIEAPSTPEQAVDRMLSSTRTLVFSDKSDAVDAALIKRTSESGQPYLRLTIHDQGDLDRLMNTLVIPYGGGASTRKPGPLPELLTSGGVLMIDYNDSDPKLVESFNSMFDKNPYFESIKIRPDVNLTIVGVMKRGSVDKHSISFYSRFRRILPFNFEFTDPISLVKPYPTSKEARPVSRQFIGTIINGRSEDVSEQIPDDPRMHVALSGAHKIDLYGTPYFRERFFGPIGLHPQGGISRAFSGALYAAIRDNKPLIVTGGPWENPSFTHFIRQMLMTGRVDIYGQTLTLPDGFRIYRQDVNYSSGLQGKRILLPGEATNSSPVRIINRATQDSLFEQSVVIDGRLVQNEGLLDERGSGAKHLRITEPLDDWVWHWIMHSFDSLDIEVEPGIPVPKAYQSLRSEGFIRAVPTVKRESFADVVHAKSALIETDDFSFANERITASLENRHVVIYPITPETTLSDLLFSHDANGIEDEEFKFKVGSKGILGALSNGDTVVLEGLQNNLDLARQLESALSEHPYFLHRGEVIDLNHLPGQLLVTTAAESKSTIQTAHRATLTTSDDELAAILKSEFPDRFQKSDFEKILRLRRAFNTIPQPPQNGLYPDRPDFSLDRLRLLYRYGDWLEGFENVFISFYADAPNVSSFMRTQVRRIFEIEEPGRQPHSFVGHKLDESLNRLIPHKPEGRHLWELTDAMSLDLLKALPLSDDYRVIAAKAIREEVDRALIKGSTGERQAFYRHRSKINSDVSGAATIDMQSNVGESTQQGLIKAIRRAFTVTSLVMLKGIPGVGKSYIAAEKIAPDLGYRSDEVFGPITVGSDADEQSAVARRQVKDGRTELRDETVAKWARRTEGGLLIVDEANLTNPAFWNFLEGLFSAEPHIWIDGHRVPLSNRHRVLFTGNQESVTGRRFQQLIQRHAITVHFPPPSDAFLRERMNETLEPRIVSSSREELITLILDLHRLFERMGTDDVTFSLRDIQELVARLNVSPAGPHWTREDVVGKAWELYQGNFNPEQRLALEHLINEKYGVVVEKWEQTRIDQLRREKGAAFAKGKITLVDATARMVHAIDDFLAMRRERISARAILQGKIGMILEGFSGRGKDDPLEIAAITNGLVSDLDAPAGTLPDKLFYHRTARPDNNEELLAVIEKAKREGSLVIISELDLLPSAFIEGKLNDALTGNAHPGFAFIATINSTSAKAREKLSTALLNRVIYRREADYTETELREIVADQAKDLLSAKRITDEDIRHAVRAHLWIGESSPYPNLRPTPRELIRLIDLWREEPGAISSSRATELLVDVYGPLYLSEILNDRPLPERGWLLVTFSPQSSVDDKRMLQYHLQTLVKSAIPPTVYLHGAISSDKPAAYHTGADNGYTLKANAFSNGRWEEAALHEAGHGIRTRQISGLTPFKGDPLDPLFQDLEDVRQLNGMVSTLPASQMDIASTIQMDFAAIVRRLDFEALRDWSQSLEHPLIPREMFSYFLVTHAKGLISREEATFFAELVEGVLPSNPFRAALPFLTAATEIAQAFSVVDKEEEHQFQQYRMLTRLKEMRSAYVDDVPAVTRQSRIASAEEQQAIIQSASEALNAHALRPQALPAIQPQAPREDPANRLSNHVAQAMKVHEEMARSMRNAHRADIDRELDQIESDLRWRGGVSPERLEEIKATLTKKNDPSQLFLKIRQLNDPSTNRRVKAILRRANDVNSSDRQMPFWIDQLFGRLSDFVDRLDRWMASSGPSRLDRWFEWLDDRFRSLGTSHAPGDAIDSSRQRGLNRPEPIGPRRTGNAAHRADGTDGIVSMPITPKGFSKSTQPLSGRETSFRDSRLEVISTSDSRELDAALGDFVERKMDIGSVYGSDGGILDVERLLLTHDLSKSYRRSGSRYKDSPKEIVLQDAGILTSIQREVLHYLMGQGYTFTLYSPDGQYTEGIRTLSDLEKVEPRSDLLARDEIEGDLQKRKGNSGYVLTTVEELQARVESIYLYSALNRAMENTLGGTPQDVADSDFENDYLTASKILERNGMDPGHITPYYDSRTLALEVDPTTASGDSLDDLTTVKSLTTLGLFTADLSKLPGIYKVLPQIRSLSIMPYSHVGYQRHARQAMQSFPWMEMTQLETLRVEPWVLPSTMFVADLPNLKTIEFTGPFATTDPETSQYAEEIFRVRPDVKIVPADHPQVWTYAITDTAMDYVNRYLNPFWKVPPVVRSTHVRVVGQRSLTNDTIENLPPLRHVTEIDLRDAVEPAPDLTALLRQPDLELVRLDDAQLKQIGMDSVYRFVHLHRNPDIRVAFSGGLVTKASVPQTEIDKWAAELEQIRNNARGAVVGPSDHEIFEQLALVNMRSRVDRIMTTLFGRFPKERYVYDAGKKMLALDLTGAKIPDEIFVALKQLPELVHLAIDDLPYDANVIEGLEALTTLIMGESFMQKDRLAILKNLKVIVLPYKEPSVEYTAARMTITFNHPNKGLTFLPQEKAKSAWGNFKFEAGKVPSSQSNDEFDAQVDQAKALLARYRWSESRVESAKGTQFFGLSFERNYQNIGGLEGQPIDLNKIGELTELSYLHLEEQGIDDFAAIEKLKKLKVLAFSDKTVKEPLAGLAKLPNLGSLTLINSSRLLEDVYELFVMHPNRKNLVVVFGNQGIVDWNSVPAHYKSAAMFQEYMTTTMATNSSVRKVGAFLTQMRLSRNRVSQSSTNDDYFSLNLADDQNGTFENAKDISVDFHALASLTELTDLHLEKVTTDDLNALHALKRLRRLHLVDSNSGSLQELRHFANLRLITLDASTRSQTELYNLFAIHPNREQLTISLNGEQMTWKDVPGWYKVTSPVEKTREQISWLADHGYVDLTARHPTADSFGLTDRVRKGIDVNMLEGLPSLPNLTVIETENLSLDPERLSKALARQDHLTTLRLTMPLTPEESVQHTLRLIFEAHPNRDNFTISVRREVNGPATPYTIHGLTGVHAEPTTTEAPAPSIGANDIKFLRDLVNSLVKRTQTLDAVRERFARDGRQPLFDSILITVSPQSVWSASPQISARTAPASLSISNPFRTFFATIIRALKTFIEFQGVRRLGRLALSASA